MTHPIIFHPLDGTLPDSALVGARARRIARMRKAGLPVPPAVALDFAAVAALTEGADLPPLPEGFTLPVSLRGSAGDSAWGGPQAMLNIGFGPDTRNTIATTLGEAAAWELERRLIQTFGTRVAGLDLEDFENLYYDQLKLSPQPEEEDLAAIVAAAHEFYADEEGEEFPMDARLQLGRAVRAMAGEWHATTARILREAKGAPPDAGLGLVVQQMVFGLGEGSGAGMFQAVESNSGRPTRTGRFLPNAQGTDAQRGARTPHLISAEERAAAGQSLPALEELFPEIYANLLARHAEVTALFGEQMALFFTIARGEFWILDAVPVRRNPEAAIRIAVDLAKAGYITREQALLRVEPRNIGETLHPQIDKDARRDVFGSGLPASPGGATGRICFSSEAAAALHAQDQSSILVRVETSPEDIRGMHVTAAVLTVRGGMTSHAAVIARGLGVPCVVGASDLDLNLRDGTLTALDGRIFREGDIITIDGTTGQAIAGTMKMQPAAPSDALDTLLEWADQTRRLGVRANADTAQDASLARRFKVDGIGLCRTEHTFFQGERINAMREMILAEDRTSRDRALARMLPMQRGDFEDLFEIMRGLPVTIRLLDPPLHEFLPHSATERAQLAREMDIPVEKLTHRIEDMAEFNPMLGKRGVRLGITMPEIYDMQARAIFEAALNAGKKTGAQIVPEIMIPLVSANREVELVKERIAEVAKAVEMENQASVQYHVGVMVETPRGALRAGDLARSTTFLSFGTNDLTQMAYGLSRDDAGRFMRDYVGKGVFPEDPFHTLDLEGVGELLLLAARRGRSENSDLTLGLCGEHGGDPASIRFCDVAGFDYVSCSPFRVPVARLAAAQSAILSAKRGE
ncbi:pyruvate, phosphate dikinase [Algicella marina]|uniref:Pyruvate, phosphate dikinase n=1 Tax=Algicella marina TaxID=2683284 RepID=A0A6P1SX96_9RHOB|nr:pyruvate, phosphate dikinase [Algicella marina]QHQ34290.1 pyruvate, phosphate dikinase [Algicella marina]